MDSSVLRASPQFAQQGLVAVVVAVGHPKVEPSVVEAAVPSSSPVLCHVLAALLRIYLVLLTNDSLFLDELLFDQIIRYTAVLVALVVLHILGMVRLRLIVNTIAIVFLQSLLRVD